MKIDKYKILITLNVLLCSFFGYLVLSGEIFATPFSLGSFMHYYLPWLLQLLFIFLNAYSVYYLLKSGNRTNKIFLTQLVVTIHTIFWFLLLVIGYFTVDTPLFLIVSLIIIVGIFLLLKKISAKLAKLLTVMTAMTVLLIIVFYFEENYCWDKGVEADPAGVKWVEANSEEEKEITSNFGIESQQVSLSFLGHMKCHKEFDFYKALKEKYFPLELL